MPRRRQDETFTLKAFTNASGSKSWRVAGTWPPGNPVRRNFKRKSDAIEALGALEAEAAGGGGGGAPHLRRTSLTSDQISDAEAAIQSIGIRRLSQVVGQFLGLEARAHAKGLTLDAAMAFAESRYRSEVKDISILNARDEFLRTRENLAPRTVQSYESSTKKLLIPDPNRMLHTMEVSDIEGLLVRHANLNTRKSHRRAFSAFFNWAVRHHYCLENPCDRLDTIIADQSPISILSIKEVNRLLQAAVEYKDGVMVPAIAIALFGGLRPSEIADLKEGDMKSTLIKVSGGKMRRKTNRNVPVPPNLVEWLETYPFPGYPEAFDYRLKVLRTATKAENWVQDILRHTSISFQAMRDQNEALTAFNNGTSKAMMDRHYREVIDDPKVVEAYWAITPQSLAKTKVKVTLPGAQDTEWPTKARLRKLVWKKPMVHAAKEIGVSDVALKKHCVKQGIDLPPRGHWLRQRR